jgi:aspartate racemase
VVRNGNRSIGLLTSPTTNKIGLYHTAFEAKDIKVLTLSPRNQQAIERIIRNVIAMKVTSRDTDTLKQMHKKLLDAGAEAVIMGCTELSTLLLGKMSKTIDPLQEITSVIMQLNSRNNV